MTNENEELIRRAYGAYARGDVAALLAFIDPELEWTYLDPALKSPKPQVCHGRGVLESVLAVSAEHGFRAAIEEVTGSGDRVMVTVHMPGIDSYFARPVDDRASSVVGPRRSDRCAARLP